MKVLSTILAILIAVVFVSSAIAVGPGKTVEFAGGGAGKVIFDGKSHADKGGKCADCHPKLFPMKKSPAGTYTMASMDKGENCGACHDGKKAFATNTPADCGKCHKK